MPKAMLPRLTTSAVIVSLFLIAPAMAQSTNAPPAQPDTSGGNIIAPPSPNTPGTPTAPDGNVENSPAQGPISGNGVSPQSSSEQDKPSGPVADQDVFGFDITGGAAGLTAEQLTAAKNTCNERVTIDPQRYSSAVKAFCTSLAN